MPYRLQAHVWRGLLSRAALLEARSGHLGAFSSLVHGGSTVVDNVLGALHLSAAHGGGARSDAEAIAETERLWQLKLEEALATPRLSDDEVDLLQRLSACPCNGASADPFAALHREIAQRAATLYGAAWPDELRLALVPLEDHPRTPPDAYAVSGQTMRTPRGVLVELHIHPDGLGPASFLAIPVLLAHECICHVAPCAADQPINSESPFAEGLMDWTSLYHVREWLPQLSPTMAAAARSHSQLFAAAAVPQGHRSYSARIVGWQAAEELVSQLMGREGFGEPAAEALVASFAVGMNISRSSGDERDAVVQRLEMGALTLADPTLRTIVVDAGTVDALF